jgi:hypothetical protein
MYVSITIKELDELKAKAAKYEDLRAKLDEIYKTDDEGELLDSDADLVTIGEMVAMHFGYL